MKVMHSTAHGTYSVWPWRPIVTARPTAKSSCESPTLRGSASCYSRGMDRCAEPSAFGSAQIGAWPPASGGSSLIAVELTRIARLIGS
jgi:hypothetical protein